MYEANICDVSSANIRIHKLPTNASYISEWSEPARVGKCYLQVAGCPRSRSEVCSSCQIETGFNWSKMNARFSILSCYLLTYSYWWMLFLFVRTDDLRSPKKPAIIQQLLWNVGLWFWNWKVILKGNIWTLQHCQSTAIVYSTFEKQNLDRTFHHKFNDFKTRLVIVGYLLCFVFWISINLLLAPVKYQRVLLEMVLHLGTVHKFSFYSSNCEKWNALKCTNTILFGATNHKFTSSEGQ